MSAKKGLLQVVRKLCLWCQGQSWPMVLKCTQNDCPLHDCRAAPETGDEQILAALHGFCIQCAGSVEAVQSCTADQSIGGHAPCPAHPMRMGDNTAWIQQTPCLPGLDLGPGIQKVLRKKPSAQIKASADAQPLPSRCTATLYRVMQLPFLFSSRFPQAPDI